MSAPKRKLAADNYDSDVMILDSSNSSSNSVDEVARILLTEAPAKGPKPNEPPTIVSKMKPKRSSAAMNQPPPAPGPVTGANSGTSLGSLAQSIQEVRSDLKEVHRKLDILLSWVGKLKRSATVQPGEDAAPQPKAVRRAATTPDFYLN